MLETPSFHKLILSLPSDKPHVDEVTNHMKISVRSTLQYAQNTKEDQQEEREEV